LINFINPFSFLYKVVIPPFLHRGANCHAQKLPLNAYLVLDFHLGVSNNPRQVSEAMIAHTFSLVEEKLATGKNLRVLLLGD
jgi:hypothetical protein